ncbi:DUF3631 domain-containing protein [Yinghuangia sp. ASG 101]|uniref:DUF3631 domain-containing protein n=1 Tax=Yinghuangia sp. ASG 101 TaxID=2896848 RepID=UPI001E62E472|nr:DUF3631 domain-containing protein [Yinghuangia sp. ASG 101]UGQ10038.1 DUF3631 domain-containing protein [Yinghuangia sp. ASG 101]
MTESPSQPLKSALPPEHTGPRVDGSAVLDDVEAFHRRFNVFPLESAYVAVTLWDAHAHLVDCFDATPRLAFLSPEPASGKSRALEIVETLVPAPMVAVSASAAALFRSVAGDVRPTVLFDEIDTVFGPKAGENEELRGWLNAGHRRSGVTYRCVGDGSSQNVQAFPSYCAVAVAGLGSLPDTILTRSVIIRMRRRAPNEQVEPFRQRVHTDEGNEIRNRLAAWATTVREQVANAWPEMPEGITDRPADVWEALLAVADAAGGDWPERARAACVELVEAARDVKASNGIRLLTDLRDHVFRGAERMPTAVILEHLNAMDDAPWADLNGKALDSRGLAKLLKEYVTASNSPIVARNIRTNAGPIVKGYYAADLHDAWSRYCPPPLESPLHPLQAPETAH